MKWQSTGSNKMDSVTLIKLPQAVEMKPMCQSLLRKSRNKLIATSSVRLTIPFIFIKDEVPSSFFLFFYFENGNWRILLKHKFFAWQLKYDEGPLDGNSVTLHRHFSCSWYSTEANLWAHNYKDGKEEVEEDLNRYYFCHSGCDSYVASCE